VLALFTQKEFVQIRKYRGALKRWHLGEIKNIVVHQKMGGSVKTKYRGATKERRLGEIKSIVTRQTMASR
jgi:hypothetical protein